MNGFDLLERVRSQDKLRNLPIVMVTGREDIFSVDRAYAAGATSFTTKPVNWRQLSHHLRYVIRASKPRSGASATQDHRSAGNSSAAWMSTPKRREFATSLGAIINAAKRIANGRSPAGEAAHEIISAAEELMLRQLVNPDQAEGSAATFQRAPQQPLPRPN